jgi:transposase
LGAYFTDWGCHTKKDLQALEQKRKDVADLRRVWITKRQPFMANHLERLAFIDETSVKTNMAKTTGWAPRGQRLIDHAPFGHWRTQTFIGALRHDRFDAPWVIDGAMNAEMFDLYAQTHLSPTLRESDVVILDNLSSHKSPGAARALRKVGAWFLFLPPYSPDLNPIEMTFSKLKALIRKAVARTYDQLWQAVGHVSELFTDEKCYNFFKAAGYKAD